VLRVIVDGMADQSLRVLFLCTGNSARSQMAEALLRHLSKGRVAAFSAGSAPNAEVHPAAKSTLERIFGIDTTLLRPKSMHQFLGERFDYVITVCDRAAEVCPIFPGDPQRIHWSFDDPAAVTDADARERAFEHVANGLASRLRTWMSRPDVRGRLIARQRDEAIRTRRPR
jgi:ArsR family transcriptional regulator, arsenate/arsenite/antimonite-responsive transcriptional repressor / arsenate reductase (thioredoxin)